ncbi:MAG TPA: MFS transporter [Anaerolineales bacterium]|nr:MFS transporter [Anaerolineales bacterium]
MESSISMSKVVLSPKHAVRWIGLIFIGIALLTVSLDNTIMNIALPTLSRELVATTEQLQWVTDAYTLSFASLLLISGAISDRYGRRKTLLIGLMLFGIGSATVTIVTSINTLILVRTLLGIAGSLIMPATLSIINVTFSTEERPQAIAIWSLIFAVGMMLGPVLSGFLLRYFSWHVLFLINVPIATVSIWGCARYLDESRDESIPSIDIVGGLLSTAGLFAIIYGMIAAGTVGWADPSVLLSFLVSIIVLAVFAWWEMRTSAPVLPMYLFKNMSFTGASLALTLVMFSMAGGMFSLSQYMQTVLNYSPFQAGLSMLPLPIVVMIVTPLATKLLQKIGIKLSITIGLSLVTISLFYMSIFYTSNASYSLIVIGQVLMASGMGITMPSATNSIMGAIPAAKSGIGSAMNDTTRELGNAFGVALLGSLINSTYLAGVQDLKILLPQVSGEVLASISSSIQTAHTVAQSLDAVTGALIIKVANQAFVSGMNLALAVGGGIMLCACVFVFLTVPAKIQQTKTNWG